MQKIAAFWLGILGVLFFVLTTILAGMQLANYSHISQLISESYAVDTPYSTSLRYFGYIPSGIFITTFSILAIKTLPNSTLTRIGFLGIGCFYGLATIIVGIFPCDKGCNKELIDPSLSQIIHNFTGMLTYMIVPASLIILGIAARKWTNGQQLSYLGFICGFISIIFVYKLSSDLQSTVAGLFQRIIECSILVWIIACAFYLKSIDESKPVTK